MKITKSMIYKPTVESDELYLYWDNTGELWTGIEYAIEGLKRHVKRGNYSHDKAVLRLFPLATEAAKHYAKKFASVNEYGKIFDVTARYTASIDMLDYIEKEFLFKEA